MLLIKAVLIISVFIFFAALMYARFLPALIALPVMAVAISLAAGMPPSDIMLQVITLGSAKLSMAMITVFFGAMLGQLIKNTGVAKSVVRNVAELSGDNPLFVSAALMIVTALLFTVLGGLGAVIMLATIVLPVMLSMGVPPVTATSIFLIGISLGGILNLANWQLYMSVLRLEQSQVLSFALPLFVLMLIVSVIFLLVELRRGNLSYLCCAYPIEEDEKVGLLSLFTPLVPLVLVFGFSAYNILARPAVAYEFPIIAAMFIGLVYGVVTTWKGWERSINTLTKSVIDGVSSSAPAIALILGIGMLLSAVMHPAVAEAMNPVIAAILPGTSIGYVLFFSLLCPLALYRGPLNIWGLGSGLIGIMLASQRLSPQAIMAAMLSVGQMQGVADPTNTFNVWIANHLNISVHDILKKTILYMWALAVAGLILSAVRYF